MHKSNHFPFSFLFLFLRQDLEGVEEFIREHHEKLVAIGEVGNFEG